MNTNNRDAVTHACARNTSALTCFVSSSSFASVCILVCLSSTSKSPSTSNKMPCTHSNPCCSQLCWQLFVLDGRQFERWSGGKQGHMALGKERRMPYFACKKQHECRFCSSICGEKNQCWGFEHVLPAQCATPSASKPNSVAKDCAEPLTTTGLCLLFCVSSPSFHTPFVDSHGKSCNFSHSIVLKMSKNSVDSVWHFQTQTLLGKRPQPLAECVLEFDFRANLSGQGEFVQIRMVCPSANLGWSVLLSCRKIQRQFGCMKLRRALPIEGSFWPKQWCERQTFHLLKISISHCSENVVILFGFCMSNVDAKNQKKENMKKSHQLCFTFKKTIIIVVRHAHSNASWQDHLLSLNVSKFPCHHLCFVFFATMSNAWANELTSSDCHHPSMDSSISMFCIDNKDRLTRSLASSSIRQQHSPFRITLEQTQQMV